MNTNPGERNLQCWIYVTPHTKLQASSPLKIAPAWMLGRRARHDQHDGRVGVAAQNRRRHDRAGGLGHRAGYGAAIGTRPEIRAKCSAAGTSSRVHSVNPRRAKNAVAVVVSRYGVPMPRDIASPLSASNNRPPVPAPRWEATTVAENKSMSSRCQYASILFELS
ncbi:hypothetical protein [Duganella sp. CF517]|uniref:hypothetical protein n=1 Tax=Duganella sp. CF517 TaxID=1881038 RepID=UPI001160554A|nr:hypothetical protein [Duganella sp. CF517]